MKWYRKSPPIWFLLISLAVALLVASLYLVSSIPARYGNSVVIEVGDEWPREIYEYRLVEVKEGDDALSSISKIHPFLAKDPGLRDVVILIYASDKGVIHIYATSFNSSSYATKLLERMYKAMSLGLSPYTQPSKQLINNTEVYVGSGSDMSYFFFSEGETVVWVSYSDASIFNSGVAEILISMFKTRSL